MSSWPWGAAAQAQAGAEAATPREASCGLHRGLWWWVAPNQPLGRQIHTKGDIRPGGLGSHSEETDLSQTGRVAGRWGPGERQQATHGSTGRHLGILGILQDGLGIQCYQ